MRRFSLGSFYLRNQLSTFLFIVIPLMVVSGMTYFVIKDVVIDKVKSSRQNVLNVMALDLNKSIEDIIYATNQFSYPQSAAYEDLLAFSNIGRLTSYEEFQLYMRITELLDLAFSKTTGLNARVIYVNRGHLPISSAGMEEKDNRALLQKLERKVDEKWIREMDPSRIYWTNISSGEQPYYFLVKVIKGESNKHIGVLYVGLPYSYFNKLFTSAGTGEIALLDKSDELIYQSLAGESYEWRGETLELSVSVPKTGWKLTHRFASTEMTNEITKIFKIYSLMLSGCILVFIFISFLLSRRLHRPLFKLKNTAEQFGNGNRLIRFPVKGNDEFAVMGSAFNTMLDQINELITSVEQEQEEKRLIELQALFSQIHPHFLLNTLNSIKCELYLAGDMIRSKQIDSLMSLLRAYMRMNEKITLKRECQLLQDYVDIMKIRSGLQLKLRVEFPEELERIELPHLVLQPLVENAIVHGFKDPPEEAEIDVSAKICDRMLVIAISDNGIGMSAADTERLVNRLSSDEPVAGSKGVGLGNTLRRLSLSYGPGVGIKASPNERSGMRFEIWIPLNTPVREGVQHDGL